MKNFIICLSRIEASLATATDLKHQLENHGAYVELFEGTYGNDAVQMMEKEGRVFHPWGIKGPDCPADPNDKSVLKASTPGVKGCFYSHYRLWEKCVELDEPIAVWEDDIVLSRAYTPIDFEDVLVIALGHPTKSQGYIQYLENPKGPPMAQEYRQASMPGCCGYVIKPHAARKLVETYKNTFLPADNAINQYHIKIQIHNYICGTALVEKDGKKSLTRTKFWNTPTGKSKKDKNKCGS
jgi:GR25 family glycosyltransferase involved in LPS biosynthesis